VRCRRARGALACADTCAISRSRARRRFPYRWKPERVAEMLEFFDDVPDARRRRRRWPAAAVRAGPLAAVLFRFARRLGAASERPVAVRRGLLETGKGSTKTPARPASACIGWSGENRTAVEIYSLGVNGDQANYLYGFAKRMIDRSEELRDLLDAGEYNTAWVGAQFVLPAADVGRPQSRQQARVHWRSSTSSTSIRARSFRKRCGSASRRRSMRSS
jgi:hypothetical protein